MKDSKLLELVRSLPPGGTVWLASAGHSLWPLIRSGDLLLVRRCGPDELRRGDVALVEAPASLIAHIVTSVAPVATASIVGVADPLGLPVLGRVVAFRRGGTKYGLPDLLRPVVGLTPRAAAVLKQVPLLRRLVHRLRDQAGRPSPFSR